MWISEKFGAIQGQRGRPTGRQAERGFAAPVLRARMRRYAARGTFGYAKDRKAAELAFNKRHSPSLRASIPPVLGASRTLRAATRCLRHP